MDVAAPPATVDRRFPFPSALSGPLLGLVGVMLFFTVLIGINGELASFISYGNVRVLVHEGTIPGVLALGMLLVIITGGIDLSIGAVVALVTVITMRVYILAYHWQLPVASLLAVLAGVLTGCFAASSTATSSPGSNCLRSWSHSECSVSHADRPSGLPSDPRSLFL